MTDDQRPKTEPPADLRAAAIAVWQTYVALTDAGFTEKQALTIVGQMLIGSQGSE